MAEGKTRMVTMRMYANLVDAVKAIVQRQDRTFTAQLERFVRDALTKSELQANFFQVDVDKRTVTHASGVEFSYYDYHNEADWVATDVALVSNPSLFQGDINQLAAMAKHFAIQNGMDYCRPRKRRS
jgi:hypothetical protein